MKRFGIVLIVIMFGLVLACGSQEEKAPAKKAPPPATAEKVVTGPTGPTGSDSASRPTGSTRSRCPGASKVGAPEVISGILAAAK